MSSNQSIKLNFTNPESLLIIISMLPLLSIILWFTPGLTEIFQNIDLWVFKTLNKSLINNPTWQWFWGILNHRREVWLNLIIANSINLWIIYIAPKYNLSRTKLLMNLIYFWLAFEIFLFIEDWFFVHYINAARLSPSLVIEPWVKLSTALNNSMIVDASLTSFPSGHALAMVYWLCFTLALSPSKRINLVSIFVCLLFILPRLFSGAHWISDSIFSALLAIVCFSWAYYFSYRLKLNFKK